MGIEIYASYVPGDWPETWIDERVEIDQRDLIEFLVAAGQFNWAWHEISLKESE